MDSEVFLQRSKTLQVGVEDSAAKKEVRAPSLALDCNKACFVQLFHVMGYGRGTDDVMLAQRATGHTIRCRHLLQDSEAARVSKRARDRLKLLIR